MTKQNEEEFNPWTSYLTIGAGACLLMVRFVRDNEGWSFVEIFAVAIIVHAIYRLIKRK